MSCSQPGGVFYLFNLQKPNSAYHINDIIKYTKNGTISQISDATPSIIKDPSNPIFGYAPLSIIPVTSTTTAVTYSTNVVFSNQKLFSNA